MILAEIVTYFKAVIYLLVSLSLFILAFSGLHWKHSRGFWVHLFLAAYFVIQEVTVILSLMDVRHSSLPWIDWIRVVILTCVLVGIWKLTTKAEHETYCRMQELGEKHC